MAFSVSKKNSVWGYFEMEETPFEDAESLSALWGRRWGVNSEYGALRAVMMHRPGGEMKTVDEACYVPETDALIGPNREFYWFGKKTPDIAKMQAEHDYFASVLKKHGAEVVYTKDVPTRLTKMLNTRDVATAVPGGLVVCRTGPAMRHGEEQVATKTAAAAGVPIVKTITGAGRMEGGGFMFLDPKHAAVALSIRCNEEGIRQMKELLDAMDVDLTVLPCCGNYLHIDGNIGIVDDHTALINYPALPYFFLEKLKKLGYRLIEVDQEDPWTTVNGITIKPGVVTIVEGNNKTAERLYKAGVEVIPVPWEECAKNGGSLHCATCPLEREYV